MDVSNRHAPVKKLRLKGAQKPWITNDLKKLMAERDYSFKVGKRPGAGQEEWDNYRRLKKPHKKRNKSSGGFA